jgi:large subunit ribosomal protein L18
VILMVRGKVRIVHHRRRREGRTDFRSRLSLVRSGKPRLVVRRTVNSMTCQVVRHGREGDKTIASSSSRDLPSYGWKGSMGNLPAAYLTGYLCGTRAKAAGAKVAVLDIGLHASTKGSRIYSALKGAIDSGLEISHSPEILPSEERLKGQHIEAYSEARGKKMMLSKMFDDAKAAISKGKAAAKPASKAPASKAKPAKAAARKAAQVPKAKTAKK